MTAPAYWLFGLSGAGKTTLATQAVKYLREAGKPAILLDGDAMREGLCSDLGFTDADRTENVRRVAEVATIAATQGITVVVALITPKQSMRDLAKWIIGDDHFYPIFIDAGLEECQRRDVKGLYAKAGRGEIANFTGLTSDFERPKEPCLAVRTGEEGLEVSVGRVVGWVSG